MTWVISLEDVCDADHARVGGKGAALATMARSGIRVPNGVCVTTDAYLADVAQGGLRSKIMFEPGRKRFQDMRWEELTVDGYLGIVVKSRPRGGTRG